jgi:hypothetical protein
MPLLRNALSAASLVMSKPTILMQSASLNDVGKSVAISSANISTALDSSRCFLTNSSDATTAAAEPSDVGLARNVLKFIKKKLFSSFK